MGRPPQYTPQQRADALNLHKQHGPSEAARRTGIPKPTIVSWARRDGVQTDVAAHTAAAIAVAALSNAKRRELLAAGLLADALKLREQLFAPCVEVKIVTLSGGMNAVGEWEVARAELDQPRYSDQLTIVKAVEEAAKTANLLTGEATSRPDVGDVDAKRRALLERMDELAGRRIRNAGAG